MARVPYVDPDRAPDDVQALLADIRERRGFVSNLHRALAHAPGALRAYEALSHHCRLETPLPRRLREIVILRIAQQLPNEYEWRRHVPAALESGASEPAISDLGDWPASGAYTEQERAALRLVDEHLGPDPISDACMAELRASFSDDEVIELLMLLGHYLLTGLLILAIDLPADDTSEPASIPFEPVAR